jgi:Tfp pilus assembly PilM family ATPase
MWRKYFKKQVFLGIDVQKTTIKAALITHANIVTAQYALNVDVQLLDENACVDVFAKIQNEFGGYSYPSILGIPFSETLWKSLNFDGDITDEEIYCHLKQQNEAAFDEMLKDLYFDYEKIPDEISNDTKNKIRVVFARKKYLEKFVHAMHKTKLNLKAIDVDVCALARACCLHDFVEKDRMAAIFCVQESVLIFCVAKNNFVLYAEHISLKEICLKDAISNALKFFGTMNAEYKVDKIFLISNINEENKFSLDIPCVYQSNDFLIAHGLALWNEPA